MVVGVSWVLFFPLKVVNSNNIQVCIIFFILDQGGYSEKKIQPHYISDLFIYKHILGQLVLKRFWHCFSAQGNTWGLVFRSVILFVCWNLPLNFLSHWMEGKYSGQVSPTLIIFPLKHSHIQFIFKTMYWVSALPHTVHGSLLSRRSVVSLEDKGSFTIQCDESLDVSVQSSDDGHLDRGGKK